MSKDPEDPPIDEPASAKPDPRDRRKGDRRRASDGASGDQPERRDRRAGDRRKAPSVPDEYRARKRSINEYPLNADELEFINAIAAYKQAYGKPFPTWSEVLHVVKSLGYRKGGGNEGG